MIRRWVVVAAAAFAGSIFSTTAGAQSSNGEVDELRKELRELRAEVHALRLMLNELAELDRQRASAIYRALEGPGRGGSNAPSLPKLTEVPQPQAAEATKVAEVREAPKAAASAAAAARAERPGAGGTVVGTVSVPEGEPVAYVYVANLSDKAVKSEVVIEQSKKQFTPSWAVIQRGTTIKFPNLDNVYHNVFSRSPGNSFDLGLYNSSQEAKAHTFHEGGPVDIYCNIHPRMSASVLVVPNRYFAKVKADGTFELPGVPPGKRKIVAWAPGSESSSEWVELAGGAKAEVALKLASKSGQHKNKEGRSYGSYE